MAWASFMFGFFLNYNSSKKELLSRVWRRCWSKQVSLHICEYDLHKNQLESHGRGDTLYVITERLAADSPIYSLAEINKWMVIDLIRGVWAVLWTLVKLPVIAAASAQPDETQRGAVVLLITALHSFKGPNYQNVFAKTYHEITHKKINSPSSDTWDDTAGASSELMYFVKGHPFITEVH